MGAVFERVGEDAIFFIDISNFQTLLMPYDDKMANLTILYQWEKSREPKEPTHPPRQNEIPIP